MHNKGIHILGICGTFMAGVATLAKQQGIDVAGSDQGIYPPMSTLLESLDIAVKAGYLPENVFPAGQAAELVPELIVVGNAVSRGNPAVEAMLSRKAAYTSGPAWLRDYILPNRDVYAVAGTHGKTSTSGMLAWLLEQAGQQPGFLIGGKPGNFEHSAQLGSGSAFVVEADEYDTAFFDKRSKFVHYRPKVAILNNLEFDHADIFADIEAIKTQFHHLVRTIPANGRIIANADDDNLQATLEQGCWTPVETFSTSDQSADWFAKALLADASQFTISFQGSEPVTVNWHCFGEHNMANALAAVAAAHTGGVSVEQACAALSSFKLPAKRLQRHDNPLGVTLYEDFAHHPTAIAKTLQTLKARHPAQRLIAILEPRSNTMKMGVHKNTLAAALAPADQAYFYRPDHSATSIEKSAKLDFFDDVSAFSQQLREDAQPNDVIVIMSNGDFAGLVRLLTTPNQPK